MCVCCWWYIAQSVEYWQYCMQPNWNCVSKDRMKRKNLSLPVYFGGLLSQILKATLHLYLGSPLLCSLPLPSPLSSSVDHGKLISICFTVISHNSSIAAAVPAHWARLPQRQPSLSASLAPARSSGSPHTPRFSGVFRLLHPNTQHCCYKRVMSSSSSRVCCHFLHILWSACYTAVPCSSS